MWSRKPKSDEDGGDFVEISEVKDEGGLASGFLASYLLPFLTIPEPSVPDIIAYGLFLLVAATIYVRSEMAQVNPTMKRAPTSSKVRRQHHRQFHSHPWVHPAHRAPEKTATTCLQTPSILRWDQIANQAPNSVHAGRSYACRPSASAGKATIVVRRTRHSADDGASFPENCGRAACSLLVWRAQSA